jgi:hypothetical protein
MDSDLAKQGGILFRLIKPYPGFKPKTKPVGDAEKHGGAINDKTNGLSDKLKRKER